MRMFAPLLARLATGLCLCLFPLQPSWGETLRVGTEGSYVPFNYFNAEGRLTGFDTEIALAICAELAVKCEFILNDWPSIIDGLENGRYDVIIGSMSITEERRERVLFTEKYYSNALRYVAPKEAVADLAAAFHPENMRIAAQKGSVAAKYLEENYASSAILRLLPNQEEVFNELLQGHVDLALADALPSYDWLQTLDGRCCRFAGGPIVADEGIGMAVRKSEAALRDRLNAALAKILADGTYDRINARYFPFSIY